MFANNQFNTFNKSKKYFINKSSKTNSIENHLKLSQEAKPFKPESDFFENFKNNPNKNKTINQELNLKNKPNGILNDSSNYNKRFSIESASMNPIHNNYASSGNEK